MALHHAAPAEIVDVRPLGARLRESVTATLLKSAHLQVFRLILPQGKAFREHQVPGEIIVQCLEGTVAFSSPGRTQTLREGELLYLDGDAPHALAGVEDASVLVTIFLKPRLAAPAGEEAP